MQGPLRTVPLQSTWRHSNVDLGSACNLGLWQTPVVHPLRTLTTHATHASSKHNKQVSLNKWPTSPSCIGVEIRHWRVFQREEAKINKESWVPKNWCFWTVVLEKTLESFLDCKEIQWVHPRKPVLNIHWKDWCWSWNSNTLASWCSELARLKGPECWKRLKAGGEGATEDKMVGWLYWLDGQEFEQALGVGEGLGSLVCCSPWGHKESDMTG